MSTVTAAQPLAANPVVTAALVPPLVLARMLNEYAYCPRLFFLEWVDSLGASSADVAEGSQRHRRVVRADSVMVINLGPAGDSSRFLFLGQHEKLPTSAAVVV